MYIPYRAKWGGGGQDFSRGGGPGPTLATALVLHKGQFILTRSTEHGTRSTQHAARSTQHAARSTQHGSIFIYTSTYRSCVRMIKYIVFNEKVEICSTLEFLSVLRAACSVLRAKHFNHTSMPTVTNCVTRFPCSMGSATGWQGEHCPPNLKQNYIMRLANLNFWSNIYSSGSRGDRGNVPPPNTKFLELRE